MSATLLQGNALAVLATLPAGSVQTCVTSPPYYGLRDYGADGQIGLEATPEAYVAKLVAVFREVRRVLADDGTLWVNLGDSYAANRGYQVPDGKWKDVGNSRGMKADDMGLKPKDLIGIPWMVAFALRADGWYLRSEIIWHKPNPMPESVTDRPTKSHEQIFLLSKRATYYYDSEAIAERGYGQPAGHQNKLYSNDGQIDRLNRAKEKQRLEIEQNGFVMRNRRSVWTVATQPYAEAHFATYPPDLIEPCILAGTCAKGQCPECGKAWVRVVEVEDKPSAWKSGNPGALTVGKQYNKDHGEGAREKTTIGWQPQCECGLEPVPQTVLDPFNGAGTTGLVSIRHGRNYIGVDISPEYLELTRKRLAGVPVALFPLPAKASRKPAPEAAAVELPLGSGEGAAS